MTREEIISGLQMTMDLIQLNPVTGNVRPIYELNDLDKTTYLACKEAIEALKAQDGTDTNVGTNDLISRSDAIDVIFSEPLYESGMKKRDADAVVPAIYEKIKSLPSAQPEPIRINLNEPIKVKLTDWGKEIYYHQYDKTNQIAGRNILKPEFPKKDENGYTKFQLWYFMELYGEHMGMILPNVIEPLEIVYER